MLVVITLGVGAVAVAGAMMRKNTTTVIAGETIVNLGLEPNRLSVQMSIDC